MASSHSGPTEQSVARQIAHEAALAVLDAAIARQWRRMVEQSEEFKRTGDSAAWARMIGHQRAHKQFRAVRARVVRRAAAQGVRDE